MGGRSAPLLMIGLGTIALYVAYTGRLQGIWAGLTGKYDKSPTAPNAGTPIPGWGPPSGTTGTGTTPVPNPVGPPSQGGEGNRHGVYTVTASGDMVVTNPGIW